MSDESPQTNPIRRQSASVRSLASDINNLSTGSSRGSGLSNTAPVTKEETKPLTWRTAIDHATNRAYYYDTVTRQTQWRKPLELCSAKERDEIESKQSAEKSFFAEMEANVMRNIKRGDATGEKLDQELRRRRDSDSNAAAGENEDDFQEVAFAKPYLDPPPTTRAVRTISSMDDLLLAELTKSTKSNTKAKQEGHRSLDDNASAGEIRSHAMQAGDLRYANAVRSSSRGLLPTNLSRDASFDSADSIDDADGMAIIRNMASSLSLSSAEGTVSPNNNLYASAESSNSSSNNANPLLFPESSSLSTSTFAGPPRLQHRNSGSTIYVGSTMSAPDKDGMLGVVGGMFRAHIMQSADEEINGRLTGMDGVFQEYDVFNDKGFRKKESSSPVPPIDESKEEEKDDASRRFQEKKREVMSKVPSLNEVTTFYRDVFRKSQMESDCIIMSLIYVERLLKQTKGGIRLTYKNWQSIIFSSMVMASKVWDDLSMWNADFSQVCSSFTLQRINELELAYLDALRYDVKVTASEYAKYYFLLRSMLMKSGLGGDHIERLQPLDIEGARKIEVFSEEYGVSAQSTDSIKRRAVSMSDFDDGKEIDFGKKHEVKKFEKKGSDVGGGADRRRSSITKAGVSIEQLMKDPHNSGKDGGRK